MVGARNVAALVLSEVKRAGPGWRASVGGAVPKAATAFYGCAVTGAGPVDGVMFLPDEGLPEAVVLAAARDILALQGLVAPERLFARRGSLLVRAASRVRAEAGDGQGNLRHRAGPDDVQVKAVREPYGQFFAVEEYDLAWRQFDGRMGPVVTRAAFVAGDAVTVLPYDPQRGRVLVVEQFRTGPLARGDGQPWQLEAIAGRIDPGEAPEAAARREALEEAGLTLGALHKVAGYYPSPGAVSEYLYSYVAVCDLPDNAAGVFGLAEEAEDIRGHLLTLEDLLGQITRGEVDNAPLILTAWWLAANRALLG